MSLARLAAFLLCAPGVPSLTPPLQAAPATASSGPAAPTTPGKGLSARPPVQPTVLQTVPLPGEPGRALRIEIGPCRKPAECPYQVSLVSGNAIIVTRPFDWVSATPLPERTSDTSRWGSGDLIAPRQIEGWSSGEEQRFVGMIARPFRLSSSIGAVLVDFIGGFEHLKREHFVLAATGDGLIDAWIEKDGPGPTWSSVALTDLPDSRQGLVFFRGADTAAGDTDTPDELDVQVLAWSDKEKRLVPQPRQGRVFAIVIGPFRTVEAAAKVRESQDACVGPSSVRPVKGFRPVGTRGFVLVRLTSSPAAAKSTLATTRTCLPKLRAAIVPLK